MNKKLPILFAYLKELFPAPETELHSSTPFQFLVAVMLSAQATDIQVNKVTDILFEKIKYPEDLLAMGLAPFERAISSINYYHTKAKHIYATASLLMKNEKGKTPAHGEQVNNESNLLKNLSVLRTSPFKKGRQDGIPDTLEALMLLPGIGVKTAKLVLHVLYAKPYIAVDTHIHRVSNRLGLVQTTDPDKTSELLEKIIPDKYKDHAHHALVLFGRYYCTAKNPACESCKLQKICDYYKSSPRSTARTSFSKGGI